MLPEEDPIQSQVNSEDAISEEELALLMSDTGDLFADEFMPVTAANNKPSSDLGSSGGSPGEERTLSQAEIDALLASLGQNDD